MSSEHLSVQPPHPLNSKEKAFLQACSPKEKQLHALASKMLGSSYFVGKTHGFKAWTAKQSNPNTQPPKAK